MLTVSLKKPLKVIGNGNVNGIDLSHFDPSLYPIEKQTEIRTDWGLEPTDFVFTFIGRIVFDKGIVEMVTAFIDICKANDKVRLLLVGPKEEALDPLPAHISKEIEDNPNIISAGWQQDVRPFFAVTNVFVFPSYREGFPNVVLQVGAMGRYSIVTDINGSNEIIEEGSNGTIIPVKDTAALTEAMAKVLKNKTKFENFDPAYRKLIGDKYSQNYVWQAQLEEYKALEEN